MANWEKADGVPVTTERRVRVFCPETGQAGYVGLTWENRHHQPRFFGPIVTLERHIDNETGVEIEEPTVTVIDAAPTFN